MTNHETFPSPIITPELVAEQQVLLGEEWADLMVQASRDEPIDQGTEIVLRNPTVYLEDVSLYQLPSELHGCWKALFERCETTIAAAATEDKGWAPGVSSIGKLQNLLFSGSLDPGYKASVAYVMREASQLFALSSRVVPGKTSYYAGNARAMGSWITSRRPNA